MSQINIKHRCPKRELRRRCAEAFGVPEIRIIGCKRTKDVVLARHAAAYALWHKFNMSFEQIGVLLGSKHYTTVRYGIARFTERLDTNPELAQQMQKLRVVSSGRVPKRGRYKP